MQHQPRPMVSRIRDEEEEEEEEARGRRRNGEEAAGDGASGEYGSAAIMPGDSFPEAGERLIYVEEDEEEGEEGVGVGVGGGGGRTDHNSPLDPPSAESDESLLRRLRQSQARMEQIKRMLVTQRGFIVRSLRQVAESR